MSQRAIAKELHISRNTVAKYCQGDSVPWERKPPERSPSTLNEQAITFIQSCLDEDKTERLKKQQHTARQIYNRLVSELDFAGGESTVRRKVRELREKHPEAFIPLEFSPGEAMQVDWGEAKVYLDGVRTTVNLFCVRLCSSCAPFVMAFRRQNEESFLEAFVHAFQFFGGVPQKVIFDNGKVAVKSGFGAHARPQLGYTKLSAHYAFDALFCNPAEGHEKGLVEGLVGWARRNALVPVPRVKDLDALNHMLQERCIAYRSHKIQGKNATVATMFAAEQATLRPLPGYPFETAKCSHVRVNAFSVVRFETNSYSVPYEYTGSQVGIKAYAEHIEVFSKGTQIARHPRCFQREHSVYSLEHYLPILERRGRAVFNAKPVRQNLPPEFLDWLQKQAYSHKELVELLYRCIDCGWMAVWKSLEVPNASEKLEDCVAVQMVDLSLYDGLVAGKAGATHGY
jgi:transposase